MLSKNLKSVIGVLLVVVMSLGILAGCTKEENVVSVSPSTDKVVEKGTLLLKVNPEIAINYDGDGKVTELIGVNDDGKKILETINDYVGKDTKDVMSELITKIGEAGYFVEDVDGNKRQITIEIEKGSYKPYDSFFKDVIENAKKTVNTNHWYNPFNVVSDKGYGYTDYIDTDYGDGNDGITDYIDTDYGDNSDGVTDYNDTDYGYANDGVIDYDDGTTDYNDNATDYNDVTNYGTNYQETDYDHQ